MDTKKKKKKLEVRKISSMTPITISKKMTATINSENKAVPFVWVLNLIFFFGMQACVS